MYIIKRLTVHNGFILYETLTGFDALELAEILRKNNPEETIYVFDPKHNPYN